MKKIIITLSAGIIATTVFMGPASAGNNDDVAYFLGGMLGGLVLGEITRDHPRYVERVYIEEPEYERVCRTKIVRVYDPNYGTYVKRKKRFCSWVPNY
jgi:hypothetical protein